MVPTRRRSCATRREACERRPGPPPVRRPARRRSRRPGVRFPRRRHRRREGHGHRSSRGPPFPIPALGRVRRAVLRGATSRLETGCPAARGVYSRVTSEAVSAMPLRAWQRRALTKVPHRKAAGLPRRRHARRRENAAFGLRIAAELLADRTVEAITVVAPTEHLKHQWAAAAARVGLRLTRTSPIRRGDQLRLQRRSRDLCAGRVASLAPPGPDREPQDPGDPRRGAPRRRRQVLGRRDQRAFSDATRRLSLTGTPFRSDDSPIPFVTYEPQSPAGCPVQGGPRLRVLRRTGRRRRPTGGVPGVLGPGQLADQRR